MVWCKNHTFDCTSLALSLINAWVFNTNKYPTKKNTETHKLPRTVAARRWQQLVKIYYLRKVTNKQPNTET